MSGLRSFFGLCLLFAGAFLLSLLPLSSWQIWLTVGFGAVAFFLPRASFAGLALAAIPILDFSTTSGWLVLNEYDAFVLLAIGAMLARPTLRGRESRDKVDARLRFSVVFTFLMLFFLYCVGAARALWPLSPIDPNAINNAASPWFAIYIFKPIFCAFLALPLLRYITGPERVTFVRSLAVGATIVAIYLMIGSAFERWMFAGLFNFSGGYRVTLGMSAMSTGSAAIEMLLGMVAAVLAACALGSASALRWLAALLAPGLLYVAFATGSRASVVALFVVALCAVPLGFALRPQTSYRKSPRSLPMVGVVIVAVLLIGAAGALSFSPQIKKRFTTAGSDVATRIDHWRDAIARVRNTESFALGAGLGTFYSRSLIRERGDVAASIWWKADGNQALVQMNSGRFARGYGEPIRLTQRVDVRPGEKVRLDVDVVPTTKTSLLEARLCEKVLLLQDGCAQMVFNVLPAAQLGDTMRYTQELMVPPSSRRNLSPVSLSIGIVGTEKDFALRGVSLTDMAGLQRIKNPRFADGFTHWFPTSDASQLPWHAHNAIVATIFELGWLGVLVWAAFIFAALSVATRAAFSRNSSSAKRIVGAIVITLTVSLAFFGVIDSVIDVPRIVFFYVLCVLAVAVSGYRSRKRNKVHEILSENITQRSQFAD